MPYVNVRNGTRIYYEKLGEGTPLVFHSHEHRTWMFAQAPYFSRHYQVIAYDRRGTGRSSTPDGPWAQEDFSHDLAGLLDALEIEKAIVAGASTGGLMTMQFGVDYPDRVAGLIATNFTWWMWDLIKEDFWAPIAAAAGKYDTVPEIMENLGTRPIRSWAWETDSPSLYGPEAQASAFMELAARSGTLSLGSSREAIQKIVEVNSEWDLRPRQKDLEQLEVPTLIMVGASEPTRLVGNAWNLSELLPNGEFVLLPGHHMSRFEQATRFNLEIERFLERHGLR